MCKAALSTPHKLHGYFLDFEDKWVDANALRFTKWLRMTQRAGLFASSKQSLKDEAVENLKSKYGVQG